MSDTTEPVTIDQVEENKSLPATSVNPDAMVGLIERAASNPDVDIDKMERLLAMQERIVAKDAEKSFNVAMIACQRTMPGITKGTVNQQTGSKYAKLGKINELITPVYTQRGFALSFGTDDSPLEDHVRVICHVIHENGHSMRYQHDQPIDGKGIQGNANMTRSHAGASALSYGQRYLVCMIFNLTLLDDDDDGNSATTKKNPGSTYSNQQVDNKPWYNTAKEDRDGIIGALAGGRKIDDIVKNLRAKWKVSKASEKIVRSYGEEYLNT
ncbi:MAG: ERF family protein [Syntrophobacteria bacterium]